MTTIFLQLFLKGLLLANTSSATDDPDLRLVYIVHQEIENEFETEQHLLLSCHNRVRNMVNDLDIAVTLSYQPESKHCYNTTPVFVDNCDKVLIAQSVANILNDMASNLAEDYMFLPIVITPSNLSLNNPMLYVDAGITCLLMPSNYLFDSRTLLHEIMHYVSLECSNSEKDIDHVAETGFDRDILHRKFEPYNDFCWQKNLMSKDSPYARDNWLMTSSQVDYIHGMEDAEISVSRYNDRPETQTIVERAFYCPHQSNSRQLDSIEWIVGAEVLGCNRFVNVKQADLEKMESRLLAVEKHINGECFAIEKELELKALLRTEKNSPKIYVQKQREKYLVKYGKMISLIQGRLGKNVHMINSGTYDKTVEKDKVFRLSKIYKMSK